MVSVSFSRSSYLPPPDTSPRRSRAPRDVESVKLRPDLIVRSSQTKGRPSGAPRRIGLNGLMAVTRRSTFSGRRSSTERRPASPPQLLRELLKLRQLDKVLLDRQLQVVSFRFSRMSVRSTSFFSSSTRRSTSAGGRGGGSGTGLTRLAYAGVPPSEPLTTPPCRAAASRSEETSELGRKRGVDPPFRSRSTR
jgi:hypothetical protein